MAISKCGQRARLPMSLFVIRSFPVCIVAIVWQDSCQSYNVPIRKREWKKERERDENMHHLEQRNVANFNLKP